MTTSVRAGTGILFDLDGTLVDTAPDLVAALNHVLRAESLPDMSVADVRSLIGHGSAALIRRGFAASGRPVDEQRFPALRDSFLGHYSANICNHSQTFPGVRDALAELLASGARLAVCTNKPEGLARQLIAALGMTALFDAIVGGDTLPTSKPAPETALLCMNLIDCSRERCVFVGDSRTDERAARATGLPFILFPYGYQDEAEGSPVADAVLESWSDLPAIVDRLVRPRKIPT